MKIEVGIWEESSTNLNLKCIWPGARAEKEVRLKKSWVAGAMDGLQWMCASDGGVVCRDSKGGYWSGAERSGLVELPYWWREGSW